jgi:hypothetical protein
MFSIVKIRMKARKAKTVKPKTDLSFRHMLSALEKNIFMESDIQDGLKLKKI